MPRIRMIHPDFIDSISMNNCSDSAQLLFIKMWSVADDDGRLHGDVQWLASRIYPRRTDAAMMLPAWLDELEREGCLQRYAVDYNQYLNVTNWKKWQRISHPAKSKLPAPPKLRSDSGAAPEGIRKSLDENDNEAISGITPEDFFDRSEEHTSELQSH